MVGTTTTLRRSGTTTTPRRSNGNIDWEQVYSQNVRPIIDSQIAPNTSRGLMYILKNQNILVKTDYNQLIVHLRDWRKDGRISWDQIADGSGRGVINDFSDFQDPEEFVNSQVNFLRNGGRYYQRYLNTEWRWHGQPHYIEIWSEKHAIVGTIAELVKDRYVRVSFNKGNPGWGYMHENRIRLLNKLYYYDDEKKERHRRNIHIWYLGDYDKYGRHMDLELEGQLKFFSLWNFVEFKRIGLLYEQIQEYGLPTNFATGEGYEVDALNAFDPDAFRGLIEEHIDPYFDEKIHERLLERIPAKYVDDLISEKVKFQDRQKGPGKPRRSSSLQAKGEENV
jgi:hypothetical protein